MKEGRSREEVESPMRWATHLAGGGSGRVSSPGRASGRNSRCRDFGDRQNGSAAAQKENRVIWSGLVDPVAQHIRPSLLEQVTANQQDVGALVVADVANLLNSPAHEYSVRSTRPSLRPKCQSDVCTILIMLPSRLPAPRCFLFSSVLSCRGSAKVLQRRFGNHVPITDRPVSTPP